MIMSESRFQIFFFYRLIKQHSKKIYCLKLKKIGSGLHENDIVIDVNIVHTSLIQITTI